MSIIDGKFYVEPPQIPGVVYNAFRPYYILVTGVIICFLILNRPVPEQIFSLVIMASIAGCYFLFFPMSVSIDSRHVRVKYVHKLVTEPLEKFNLLIREANKNGFLTFSYAYKIVLSYKDQLPVPDDNNFLRPNNFYILLNSSDILICPRIQTPQNLRAYVESLQSHIAEPLNLIFISKKIEEDYTTGIFAKDRKTSFFQRRCKKKI